ncbi:MAG: two-component regulator propeller domain-containing protein [Dyadobacter sp.]|uniref:two-component regulator propeller domain-containing protein n=1 Tax=Dyadobacter sp. TaxID=1914288 RepID=UPI0032644A0D
MRVYIPVFVVWLIGLLMGLGNRTMAQERPPHFEFGHIREQDGLSSRKVYSLLHDREGFMWVGTNNGLNRYDGTHFVKFRHQRNNPHSLLNNQVYALCEDKRGRIWAAHENGVSNYDKTTGRFEHITTVDNQPLGVCKNARCDRAGNIWFTSRNRGLFGYTTKTAAVHYYTAEATDRTGGIRTLPNGLVEDPDQPGLWMAEAHGLRYFDTVKKQFITYRNNSRHSPVLTPNDVSALAMDGNRLLIADHTDHSILIYDLHGQRILKRIRPDSPQDRADFFGSSIFVDRRHNLWVSTWGGKSFHINTRTDRVTRLGHAQSEPNALGSDIITSAWQQSDGTIWLGTVNGLAYTNPERALYDVYDLEALFPALTDERGIMSFAEDPDGSWWLGTSIRGLLHYVPATNRLDVYRLPEQTAQYPWGMPIIGLHHWGEEILVGSATAVYRFNKRTHQFRSIALPPSARSVSLRTFRLVGNQYWVFGDGKLAFAYDMARQQWQTFPIRSASTDPRFVVRQTLLDRRGNLWLDIHPEGFARFSAQKKEFIVTDAGQAGYEATLNSLTEDRDGSFLMATDMDGLVTYDPVRRRHTVRVENEAMTFSQCTAAQSDRFGNTWVADLNLFSVITAGRKQVFNFSLPINAYTTIYSTYLFPMQNGHILSAQKGHLVEFKPQNLRPAHRPEPVLLNRLALNDTTLLLHSPTPPIRLKSDDNSFMIEFSTLAPSANQHYRYKLEGYDGWKESGTQTNAVYTKLPGGEYVFRVFAVAGDLRSLETTLAIHVDTIFYNTRWFQALLGAVVLALLYSLYRYRLRQSARLHHFQIQMTRLERDKAEIQYHNLINHLNPHFLFNSLTSLNSLILTKPKDASLFLRKLSVIYRYILQNKDSELVSLQAELTFAQNYIDLQTTRFGEGLHISISISPDSLTQRIVPVTLQNLLENAIKHNIVSDDCPLDILIYTETDRLFVQNSLQRKNFVETSNKQGLNSLKSLYHYLSPRKVTVDETATEFKVSVPLL